MFIYRITFLGGSQLEFRANSPKEAWEKASKQYEIEVIAVKYLRGK